jgi:hypothetical protein
MGKPPPSEMIVLDLGDQLGRQRLPPAHAVAELSADLYRLLLGESGRLDQLADLSGQSLAFSRLQWREDVRRRRRRTSLA